MNKVYAETVMNEIEHPKVAAESTIPPSEDSGAQAVTYTAQLKMADAGKLAAQESISQIEAAQARKKELADVLKAARFLQRAGIKGGGASSSEYVRMIETLKHARAAKGSIPMWLLKFCRSHGIALKAPATLTDPSTDSWTVAQGVLERMQAVNALCDLLGISMPAAEGMVGNNAEWATIISKLQDIMDDLGKQINTGLTQLQDTIGQYDSLLKGANTSRHN